MLVQQECLPDPILHYEVIVNGKKVNSQRLKLPSGKVLKDDERKNLKSIELKQMY